MRFPTAALMCALLPLSALAAPDDLSKTLHACGKPGYNRVMPDENGSHRRALLYSGMGLIYKQQGKAGWSLAGGFDTDHHIYSPSGAAAALPCLKKIGTGALDAQTTAGPAALTQATPPATSGSGDYGSLIVILLLGALAVFWIALRQMAWKNRPMRLCTNCYVQAQPLQHKNKRWYCGHCGADNPAPLDSPIAQAFLAKQQASTTPQLEG